MTRRVGTYPAFLLIYPALTALFLADTATLPILHLAFRYALVFCLCLAPGWFIRRAIAGEKEDPLPVKASFAFAFSVAVYTPAALLSLRTHLTIAEASVAMAVSGLLATGAAWGVLHYRGTRTKKGGNRAPDTPPADSIPRGAGRTLLYPGALLGALFLTIMACRPGAFSGETYTGWPWLAASGFLFLAASGACLLRYLGITERTGHGGLPGDEDLHLPLLTLLTVLLGIYTWRLAACQEMVFGDAWSYLAAVRDFADGGAMNIREARLGLAAPYFRDRIFVWGVFQALLSRAGGVDPVLAHNTILNVLLVPLGLASAYTLGREVLSRRAAGLASAAFLCIMVLTTAGQKEVFEGYTMANRFFLNRLAEDKAILWFIVLPTTLAALYGWVKKGEVSRYAAVLLTLIATAAIHPVGLTFAAGGLGVILAGILLIPNRGGFLRRWALVLPPLLLAVLLPLAVKAAFSGFSATMMSHPEGSRWFAQGWGSLFSQRSYQLGEHLFILREYWLTRSPATLLAILSAPLALLAFFRFRSFVLTAPAILVTCLAYTPFLLPLTAPFMHRIIAFRLLWLIPVPQILALASLALASHFRTRLRRGLAIPLALMAVLALGWSCHHPVEPWKGLRWRAENINKVPPERMDIISALKGSGAEEGLIFAPREIDLLLPAFFPGSSTLEYRVHQTFYFLGPDRIDEAAGRLRDHRRLYLKGADTYRAEKLLERYHPGAVVIRKGGQKALGEVMQGDPSWKKIMENGDYAVYLSGGA
jgi:hypothetical protein